MKECELLAIIQIREMKGCKIWNHVLYIEKNPNVYVK